jgi:mandelamide amidase
MAVNRRQALAALPAVSLALSAAARRPPWHGAEMIEMSAVAAVDAMKRGEMSAEGYAQALLARCEAGRALNAFITLEPDRVLEAARAVDRARAKGRRLGLLQGLPIPVKDSVATADYVTTAGTAALKGWRPKADAPVIARLKAAGGLVLGKTNLHELSFGWTSNNGAFGPVHNPYDVTRIPGGSTGGTAAAVAARMAPLGVAEDTQGSIRVPAALCGICGFRPTTGRYPTAGTAPITPLFDQIGPHARAVDDLVLFDAVMTGEAAALKPASLKGLKLAVARAYYFEGLDPEVARLTEAAMARLKDAGVVFVETSLPGLAALVGQVTGTVQVHDAGPAIRAWLKDEGAPVDLEQLAAGIVSPDVKGIFQRFIAKGATGAIPEAVYAQARDVGRPAMQAMLAEVFAKTGAAAMLFPATMTPATKIGEADRVDIAGKAVAFQTAVSRNISPGSTAGLPGLVLPAGLTNAGLPVAIELDGPAGSDRRLLAIGAAVQRALPSMPAPRLG